MKLNTIIKLPDGRVGTICWNNLDGSGGVWGKHHFEMPPNGFGDLPEPTFMLREKKVESLLNSNPFSINKSRTIECVGTKYTIL